jgi:single-strand DNA-binding protein
MKKGRPLLVEGRLQTRSWDDKESGKKQYRTEIVVDTFQFGSGGGSGGEGRSYNNDSASTAAPDTDTVKYPDEEINPEDIPF